MTQERTNKNKEQDYFNQLIREKIENYQALIDDNCWEEIEQALTSNRRKVALWVWISTTVAASLALLLLFRAHFPETPIKTHIDTELTDNFEEANKQPKPEELTINLVVSPENQKPTSSKKKKVKQTPAIISNQVAEKTSETEEILTSENTEDKSEKDFFDRPTADWVDSINEWEQEPVKKKKNKWLLAASLGLGNGSSLGDNLTYRELNYFGPNSQDLHREPELSENINDTFDPEEFSDATHYTPLSFGINIRKEIDNRWAIESGLTYTYLLSKFRSQQPFRDEATIEMHYIGVPLNLVAYISNNNPRWNLYVSTGGMVEKGLQLNFTRNKYDNRTVFATKLKENIPGWQYSLNTSIGVSCKIHKDISLYFEPRINYYLNNNQPKSIRTENPFIVGFSTGVRLGL